MEVNAPLAIIQIELKTQHRVLTAMLEKLTESAQLAVEVLTYEVGKLEVPRNGLVVIRVPDGIPPHIIARDMRRMEATLADKIGFSPAIVVLPVGFEVEVIEFADQEGPIQTGQLRLFDAEGDAMEPDPESATSAEPVASDNRRTVVIARHGAVERDGEPITVEVLIEGDYARVEVAADAKGEIVALNVEEQRRALEAAYLG